MIIINQSLAHHLSHKSLYPSKQMLWSSVVPWQKWSFFRGIPGIPHILSQILSSWPPGRQWISGDRRRRKGWCPSKCFTGIWDSSTQSIWSDIGWSACCACWRLGYWGMCFFFLRGTMSNTEITEMNVKVLHVCVHMYFILLYLIVYIYNWNINIFM